MKDQLTPTPPGIPPAFVEAATEANNEDSPGCKLQGEFDAMVWAKEFCRINTASDEAMMLGWFANAIMAGYDYALRNWALEDKPEVSGELEQLRESHANLKAAIPCLFWDEEEFVDSDGYRTPESSREELLVEQFEEFVAAEGWWHVQNKLAVQTDFLTPAPPTETGEAEGEQTKP